MSEFINTVDTLGDDAVCDGMIMKTLAEYKDSYVKSIGDYALYSCTALTDVELLNATSIGLFAFYGCSALKTVNLPVAEVLENYSFYSNRALESINIPMVTELGKSTFYGCSTLTSIDLPAVTLMDEKVFSNCSTLTAVILRSETMCEMTSTNAFTNTPVEEGTGYIYVPSALVESYAAGTNWSAYASQIRAIEDYPDSTGG